MSQPFSIVRKFLASSLALVLLGIPFCCEALGQDDSNDPLPDSVVKLLEIKNKLFADFRANPESTTEEKIPQVKRMVEIEEKIISTLQKGQAANLKGLEQKPDELLATTQNVTISNAGYLSGLYAQIGQYSLAAEARLHALNVAKDSLGPNHWQTREYEMRYDQAKWIAAADEETRAKWLAAAALEGQAMASYRKQDLDDAIAKFAKMKSEIEALGRQETIEYGAAVSNYAEMLVMSGKLKEAEVAFLDALKVNRKILAKDNPTMGTFLNSLAEVYRRQSKLKEALATIEESIGVMESADVKQSVKLAQIIYARGRILQQMSNVQEASKSFVAAYQMMHALGQTETPFTLAILNSQHDVYTGIGQYNDAAALAELGVKIADGIWGGESSGSASWLLKQGTDLRVIGNHEKAMEVLERSRTNYEKLESYQKNHDYILTVNNLAMANFGAGNVEKAAELADLATNLAGDLDGTDSFFYAARAQNYAIVLFGKKDYAKAAEIFDQIMPILEKRMGENHSEFQKILNDQATNTHASGKSDLAIEQWNRLLKLQEQTPGNSSPLYASTLQSLINANREKGDDKAVEALTAKLAAIKQGNEKDQTNNPNDEPASSDASMTQLQEELQARIDRIIQVIETKDAEAIFEDSVLPEDLVKLRANPDFEAIKKNFVESKGAERIKVLKSIDVSKAVVAQDGTVEFKSLDRTIKFQKVDGKWYIKN